MTRESASRATVIIGATVATVGVCALTAGVGCIVVGAIAGGAQAYGLQVIANAADGQGGLDYAKGGVFTDVNVREIAVATIAGGVFGGASKVAGNVAGFFCKVGPQCQMLIQAASGAAGAGSAQITTNVLDGNPCTGWSDHVAEQAAVGGVIGMVIGRVLSRKGSTPGQDEPPRAPSPEDPPIETPPRLPCASSFSADTLVTTADGLRPISTIHVGDLVLAYDEATHTTGMFTVTAVLIHSDPAQVHLTIGGVPIETTPEHPFFTLERGWIAAGDLWRGAHVRRVDGSYDTVWLVAVEAEPQVMYNLTVAQAHTFFVGTGRWLVHNSICDIGIQLSDYAPKPNKGTAFSGAYDPEKGQLLVAPSGETLLANGSVPKGRLPRNIGHLAVAQQLARQINSNWRKSVGFTVFYEEEGKLIVEWKSRSLNQGNYGDEMALTEFRQSILDALQKATGLQVLSR